MIHNPLWDLGALVLVAVAIAAAVRMSRVLMGLVLLLTVLYVWFT